MVAQDNIAGSKDNPFRKCLKACDIAYEGTEDSAFTWGDSFWASVADSGKCNLTLFGLSQVEAASIIDTLKKGAL